ASHALLASSIEVPKSADHPSYNLSSINRLGADQNFFSGPFIRLQSDSEFASSDRLACNVKFFHGPCVLDKQCAQLAASDWLTTYLECFGRLPLILDQRCT